MLVIPDQQDQEPLYATFGGLGKYEEVYIDAYGIPHQTGNMVSSLGRRITPVSMWKTKSGKRVRGPTEACFPQIKGWLLDKTEVDLDGLTVKK